MIIIGYVTDVLQESVVYSEHAGKTELDLEDLRLGIKNQLRHMFVQPPPRDVVLSSVVLIMHIVFTRIGGTQKFTAFAHF
jgi:hypothetical protein